jgi:hypothetical protein
MRPHPTEELAAREVSVAEDDQVGEVRPGQKQRGRVGQQQATIKERRFGAPPVSGGVHEHGCEKRDRSIEIQQRGHRPDHRRGTDEQHKAISGRLRE